MTDDVRASAGPHSFLCGRLQVKRGMQALVQIISVPAICVQPLKLG